MKQIEVQIMGQSYLLGCPEGGEPQLREAVERVDAAMCKIRDAGKVKARDRIAVLASLNLAFDLAQREAAPPRAAAAPSGARRRAALPGCRRPTTPAPPQLSSASTRPSPATAICSEGLRAPAVAGVKSTLSAVRVGLYISLFQCSTEPGLVHRLAGVIISRQMNPKPCCPRPPEPWFRMRVRPHSQTPFLRRPRPRSSGPWLFSGSLRFHDDRTPADRRTRRCSASAPAFSPACWASAAAC